MKTLIALLLPILLLTSCVTAPKQEEIRNLDYGTAPVNYEASIKKYFDDVLFDPYSAHYDFQLPQQFWYKEAPLVGNKLYAGYLVRVGVNAKNRMGGYVGKKSYGFMIKNERIIKVLNEFDLQNMKMLK